MKIKTKQTVYIEKEIDMDFPIYRKIYHEYCIDFIKVESLEKEVSINVSDNDLKYEIEVDVPSFFGDEDYLLGKGEYKSSKDEFEEALKKLKIFLDKV